MRDNAEATAMDYPVTVRERVLREVHKYKNGHRPNNGYINGAKYYTLAAKTYRGKRSIDVILSLIGLIIFGITYPFIALGIKLSSKGPVLYKQKRTGQNGKVFTCYKYRTMACTEKECIDGQPVVTQKGDPRIFAFGQFLRKTNLDELPQIINVIKGDMSLIGPRPYPVDECAHWNSTFDDFFYRYAVKPGISGLAQTTGYRGGTLDEEHMRKRLDKDLIYVQKQSLGFDLKLIGKTILQMLHMNTNGH